MLKFCKKTNLPVVASWAGFGSIDNKIKNFIGTIGVYGSRVANICLQKSDFIINLQGDEPLVNPTDLSD